MMDKYMADKLKETLREALSILTNAKDIPIPKEVEKVKDCQIIECIMDNDVPHKYIDSCLKKVDPCKIHSVKRLKDNSIWTIGDAVIESDRNNKTIEGFELRGDHIWVYTDIKYGYGCILDRAVKVKEREVLFTTEDGFVKYKNDNSNYVDTKKWVLSHWSSLPYPLHIIGNGGAKYTDFSHYKFFHNEEKAKEYILMNKPILNLNDLLSVWNDGNNFDKDYYKDAPLFLSFKRLAKNKINQ